jgi:hypothetical protein
LRTRSISRSEGATPMARMIDKQETPGASDRIEDPPSLIASRISERPIKATQRWTES